MQTLRASNAARATPFKRGAVGVPALRRVQLVRTRATEGSASDAAQAALDKATAAASEAASKATAAASEAASKATASAKEAASKLKGAINQATLDVDIKSLLQYNFIAQLALTAVSWAVVFFTSHINMAKGAGTNPTVIVLLAGVALAGYSTYLSFGYLMKSKKEGLGALDGFAQLNAFYEHATFNFLGAAATLVSLFANVGTLMVKSTGSLTLEALAQAAANTLLAHLVSLAFLMVMTRKITQAYQKLADWSAQLDSLKQSMPKFG